MLGQRFGGLAIEGGFRELFQLVERAGVEVEECGAGCWVGGEACEAGGRARLEVPGRLDGRELSKRPSHSCGGQWRGLGLLGGRELS